MPERQTAGPMPPWSRATWVAALGLCAVFLGLVVLFPHADPPWELPGLPDTRRDELLIEPPAKAHEARNWALFGAFHRNRADNYQFWRAQSPVWVYPMALALRGYGASWATLRFFSAGVTLLGLVAFLGLVRRLRPGPALATLGLLATGFYTLHFARSALVEVALCTATAWMVLILARRDLHPGWLVASQLVFATGFFAKQGMVWVFPLLVVTNLVVFVGWWRVGRYPRLRWLPVATAVVIAGVSVGLILQPDYWRTIAWNTKHLLGAQGPDFGFDPRRLWWSGAVMLPFSGVLALGGVWAAIDRYRRERRLDRTQMLVIGWWALSWVVVALLREYTFRHAAILLWPSLLLAGYALHHARRTWVLAVGYAMVGGGLLVNGITTTQGLLRTTWTVQRAAAIVETRIGDAPATIVGLRAMPVLFQTPYDLYYVKLRFNTSRRRLKALRPTHRLASVEIPYVGRILRRAGYHLGPQHPLPPVREDPLALQRVLPGLRRPKTRKRGAEAGGEDRPAPAAEVGRAPDPSTEEAE